MDQVGEVTMVALVIRSLAVQAAVEAQAVQEVQAAPAVEADAVGVEAESNPKHPLKL